MGFYRGRYEFNNSYSRYFIGEIPVVKIYNKPLSDTEVLQNFNATKK